MSKILKIKFRFWKWLYLLAEKKSRETHLHRHHNDLKCPRCRMWFSVSGLKYNHKFADVHSPFIRVTCGQCGKVSNWSSAIAPVLVEVDDNGNPIAV